MGDKLMKINKQLAALLAATVVPFAASADDDRIAQAVTPLPEDLRAEATVYEYNDAGERVVLREGSNHVECQPKNDMGFTMPPTISEEKKSFKCSKDEIFNK